MTRISATGRSFDATVAHFTETLGFRLDRISPADDPHTAVVSDGDIVVEIGRDTEIRSTEPELFIPELVAATEIMHPDGQWVIGRAGMRYRDLIPSRLGGRFIASNIEVCDGGPVPDLVHHHAIRFQLIVCEAGWVDVVYEDQGSAFRMHAGDAVLQPPHIRHRVLASSAGARVVEIGCPAEHDTLFDYELDLPTAVVSHDRDFGGQRFVHHRGADSPWSDRAPGIAEQVTAIADATSGLADVRFIVCEPECRLVEAPHTGEFEFGFVLSGDATFTVDDQRHALGQGSSFSVAAESGWALTTGARGASLLHVRL